MTILYEIEKSLYVNVTNKCPCACIFCVRLEHDSVGGCKSLWLEREPTLEEVIGEFEKVDLTQYQEVVFCGYGEPLERLEIVREVSKWIRAHSQLPIRINTNGLANLIHQKEVPPLLKGLVDSISISLNAPNKVRYNEVVRPSYGEASFEAVLKFATGCQAVIPQVTFSVVDILDEEEIEACRTLALQMGIPLRIRGQIK